MTRALPNYRSYRTNVAWTDLVVKRVEKGFRFEFWNEKKELIAYQFLFDSEAATLADSLKDPESFGPIVP